MATATSSKTKAESSEALTPEVIDLQTANSTLKTLKPMEQALLSFRQWWSSLTPASETLAKARAMKCTNVTQQAALRAEVLRIKREIATREDGFKIQIKDRLNGIRNAILGLEHQATDDLHTALRVLDDTDRAYEHAERERARKEQAEKDRIERERLAREREKEARELEERAKKLRGQEKQELKREAAIVREMPVAPAPAAVQVAPKLAVGTGTTRKANWKAEVFDENALWMACMGSAVPNGRVHRHAFMPSQDYLDAQAKQLGEKMNEPDPITGLLPFPGVRAVDHGKLAAVGSRARF